MRRKPDTWRQRKTWGNLDAASRHEYSSFCREEGWGPNGKTEGPSEAERERMETHLVREKMSAWETFRERERVLYSEAVVTQR